MNRGDRAWCGAALAATLLVATPTDAQQAGDGFLFRPPAGALTVRGGFNYARAGSDIFSFATSQLTLRPRDFSALNLGTDASVRMTPRVEVVFGWSFSSSSSPSEFRDWVDNHDRPIEQTTTFVRAPLTLSVKAYFKQPGRSVGRFAWIPARYAPYVGFGGGTMWYSFHQEGDFIDFTTTRVFHDRFASSGWTPMAQGFAGTDVSLSPHFALTADARYQWARATMKRDFSGFDRIDLSGVALTAGIAIRY